MNEDVSPEKLRQAALDLLAGTPDPLTGASLSESGRIADLLVTAARRVLVSLTATAESPRTDEALRAGLEADLARLPGATGARVVLSAEHPTRPSAQSTSPTRLPGSGAPEVTRVRKGARLSDNAAQQPVTNRAAITDLPGVGAVIAVASAKGGVGKSTVAVNLACALARLGKRVGLLDADVYGPSVPLMLGLGEAEPEIGPDQKLLPLRAWGVASMSMGYLVDADAPMIWRGPIVMSALSQFLKDVSWAPLDVLLIDTPPGTGDALLTLTQRAPLSGVVIVSTPQEAALADVRRGIAMFARTSVPILGLVENMAYFEDASGARHPIFGEAGARRTAEATGSPFLGELPLEVQVREGGDAGAPVTAALPDSPAAMRFMSLAARMLEELEQSRRSLKPAPKIVFC